MTSAPVFASAPGKVVLGGEYAVLDGAPAIVAAVNRRARVTPARHAGKDLQLSMPGFSADASVAYGDGGGLELRKGALADDAMALLGQVFIACDRPAIDGLRLELDTRDFFDGASGQKLGLGSSAALCVALCAALLPGATTADVARRATRAQRAHQQAGSGVDIASAAWGGLLRFEAGDSPPAALAFPAGLAVAIVWSGAASSTADQLARLAARRDGNASDDAALLRHATALADAWSGGDAAAVLAATDAWADALAAFDARHGLGIYSAGHATLRRAAADAGLVYKPCGAGGGDVGALFGLTTDGIESFRPRIAGQGFTALDLALGAPGLDRTG